MRLMHDDTYMFRLDGLDGPSIQIDPLFPYYRNRSAESIATEIELSGYRTVHYFVVNENQVNGELIDALHQRGIKVWAMVLGNGAYATSHLPSEWPSWKMGLLKEPNDGFERFSPFASGYVAWKKEAAAELVSTFSFDGFEIAEPYFPEWEGIRRGVYGDVGPLARQAFREQYGLEMPDFHNKWSASYYKKVPKIYQKWISFRVDAVNGLIDEIVNGSNGVRSVRPDITVATWSLAVDGGALATLRLKEWQGLDAISMIGSVKPDIHVLQTHWPDWTRRSLSPDYVMKYESFAAPIRSAFPGLPLGIQADIGSRAGMIRGRDWLNQFQNIVYDLGYDTWTAYEYHLGGYMYEDPPLPLAAERHGENEVTVVFNKRIESKFIGSIRFYPSEESKDMLNDVHARNVTVDGNRMIIQLNRLPEQSLSMEIKGVKDTPELWHIKGRKANLIPNGTRITIYNQDFAKSLK